MWNANCRKASTMLLLMAMSRNVFFYVSCLSWFLDLFYRYYKAKSVSVFSIVNEVFFNNLSFPTLLKHTIYLKSVKTLSEHSLSPNSEPIRIPSSEPNLLKTLSHTCIRSHFSSNLSSILWLWLSPNKSTPLAKTFPPSNRDAGPTGVAYN